MKVTSLLSLALWLSLFLWPSSTGNSQGNLEVGSIDTSTSPEHKIPMLMHDVEKLKKEEKEALKEVKPKVKIIPKIVEKVPDEMGVWVRYPNGDVERITFNPNEKVPIIDLVYDTIYIKKVTWLKSIFSNEEKGWKILDSSDVKLNFNEKD